MRCSASLTALHDIHRPRLTAYTIVDTFAPLKIVFWIALGAFLYRHVIHVMISQIEVSFLDDLSWGDMLSRESEPATLELRDGGLMTAYRIYPPDAEIASREDVQALAHQLQRVLESFPEGWMLHVDAIRRPSPTYPKTPEDANPVLAACDAEARARYAAETYLETRHVISLAYVPPTPHRAASRRVLTRGTEATRDYLEVRDEAFRLRLQEFEARLPRSLSARRLTSNELMQHLACCISGHDVPIKTPPYGLDVSVPLAVDYVEGFYPEIGGRRLCLIEVLDYPERARDLSEILDELGLPYRANHRVLFMSRQTATRYVERVRRDWFRQRKGPLQLLRDILSNQETRNSHRRREEDDIFKKRSVYAMMEDASEALGAINLARATAHQYTSTVLVWGGTLAEARGRAERVVAAFQEHGFAAQIARYNSGPAYLGSLPGNGYENVRRPILLSRDLSYLLPVSTPWVGLKKNPSGLFPPQTPALVYCATGGRTAARTPFRLNLHVEDVGHTVIVGATGAGKSVLVADLAAQWITRYSGGRAFIFDLGYSARQLARLASGRHYDLDAARTLPDTAQEKSADPGFALALQPARFIDQTAERTWFLSWLEVLLTLSGTELAQEDRRELARVVHLLADLKPEERTLDALALYVQRQQLRQGLTAAREQGLAPLFEADRGGLIREDATPDATPLDVFEMSRLRELSEVVYLPVLLVLLHCIEQTLDGHHPTLIVIEEAWHALANPLFRARIEEWLFTLRKKNASVVLVAHQVSQINVDGAQAILEQCPTRILLPNPGASAGRVREQYLRLGLPEPVIDLVALAQPKRDYLYASPYGYRLFSLELGPFALATVTPPVGMSQDDLARHFDRLERAHGEGWREAYYVGLGLPDPFQAKQFLRKSGAPASPYSKESPGRNTEMRARPTIFHGDGTHVPLS